MRNIFIAILGSILLFSCSRVTYYVVRHAEKETQNANMSSDVPLSEIGKERAVALKEELKNKKIGYVFSTNTIRTRTTAAPTAEYFNLPVQLYGPMPQDTFITRLRSLKRNVLIVGHSNTVDDVVNKLCAENKLQDLQDSEYDNLFIVTKKGDKFIFSQKKFGVVSN